MLSIEVYETSSVLVVVVVGGYHSNRQLSRQQREGRDLLKRGKRTL